jgi:DNA-binding GntR family transcriptional regulator
MTDADVEEIYSLRRALEMFAIDLLLVKNDPAAFAAMDPMMTAMRAAAKRGDSAGVVQANVEFHKGIVEAAGHHRLADAYRTLMLQMQLCMAANVRHEARTKGDLTKGCDRHAALLECLRSGDVDKIRREFEEHGERDYLTRDAPTEESVRTPDMQAAEG